MEHCGAAHHCWRGIGGSDGAGNNAGALLGDLSHLLAGVQLPSYGYLKFSALTSGFKLILSKLLG